MWRLRDDIWQFIGAVLAAVSLLVSVIAISDVTTRIISIIAVLGILVIIALLVKNIKSEQEGKTSLHTMNNDAVLPTIHAGGNNSSTALIDSSMIASIPYRSRFKLFKQA